MKLIDTTTKKDTTITFYEDVRSEYVRLSSIRLDGVRVYSYDFIITKLSKQFYRSPRTIENIIFNRV
ncbi:MAG: hypothetical protein LC105_06080 [Chitinophagales bacterium]|nr:hypothetical protein [Chitinophagales bacterium]